MLSLRDSNNKLDPPREHLFDRNTIMRIEGNESNGVDVEGAGLTTYRLRLNRIWTDSTAGVQSTAVRR